MIINGLLILIQFLLQVIIAILGLLQLRLVILLGLCKLRLELNRLFLSLFDGLQQLSLLIRQ